MWNGLIGKFESGESVHNCFGINHVCHLLGWGRCVSRIYMFSNDMFILFCVFDFVNASIYCSSTVSVKNLSKSFIISDLADSVKKGTESVLEGPWSWANSEICNGSENPRTGDVVAACGEAAEISCRTRLYFYISKDSYFIFFTVKVSFRYWIP